MKGFKGTKGEWLWEENSASDPNDSTCIEVRVNGPQIAYLQSFTGYGDSHSREATIANANLISAAPEMLEALQNMVESYQYEASPDNPALLQARAAIAKALGESK